MDVDIIRAWLGDRYPLKVWLVSAYYKSALCMKNAEDAMTYLINDWHSKPWDGENQRNANMELLECLDVLASGRGMFLGDIYKVKQISCSEEWYQSLVAESLRKCEECEPFRALHV